MTVMNEAVVNKMMCTVNMEETAPIMEVMERGMMLCSTGKVKVVSHQVDCLLNLPKTIAVLLNMET